MGPPVKFVKALWMASLPSNLSIFISIPHCVLHCERSNLSLPKAQFRKDWNKLSLPIRVHQQDMNLHEVRQTLIPQRELSQTAHS